MARFNYTRKRSKVLEDRIVNESYTHRKGHHKLIRGVPPSGMKRKRSFYGARGPPAGQSHYRPTGIHKRPVSRFKSKFRRGGWF